MPPSGSAVARGRAPVGDRGVIRFGLTQLIIFKCENASHL